ncbi:MAG: endolytic transglycosylase MltG [Desulfobacula sp.]|nr:endolytic transglycosylase MltG [Desulfobacula sp.]MDA8136106.1 endolytic transglycosylase MltG [Desulfobacteraceae bacterium]
MIKNRFKKFTITVISLLIIALLGGVYLFMDISSFIKKPFRPGSPEQTLTIVPGQGLKAIAEHLENQSIISNKLYFSVYAKIKKAGKKLQAGEYVLSGSKSPEEILDILVSGKVKLYRVTLPEGVTMREIAGLIEKEGLCEPEKFIALCQNPALIKKLEIQALSLEGYLFPDTYFFSRQTTCEDIISAMTGRFKSVFAETWQQRAKELGFSIHEILTLASIIEKETGAADERPLISSVFHNRLKKNMRLESDPTVIYGIEDFDGNIKKTHLQTRTGYNTYQITGLPPGPIASPGALSLEAALYPASTPYFYFVSKNDTTHYFSKTFEEHTKAVSRYQLKK